MSSRAGSSQRDWAARTSLPCFLKLAALLAGLIANSMPPSEGPGRWPQPRVALAARNSPGPRAGGPCNGTSRMSTLPLRGGARGIRGAELCPTRFGTQASLRRGASGNRWSAEPAQNQPTHLFSNWIAVTRLPSNLSLFGIQVTHGL